MISFEMQDMPNAQSITNDQFAAINEIVSLDYSRNYIITDAQETQGDWFLIVEKEQDGESVTETYFRVEFDGDWGVLFECPREEGDKADLPLILAMDDDYCPTSKDNRHRFAEDRTCDLCGASEEEP